MVLKARNQDWPGEVENSTSSGPSALWEACLELSGLGSRDEESSRSGASFDGRCVG